jgi:ubiquinone/menaquinone biosynthesis C-methylase UbiE
MRLWDRVFAAGYDRLMARTEDAGMRDRRRDLLASASGRAVEIGAGTGANVGLYPEAVTELFFTEPGEAMARRLRDKAGRQAQVVIAGAGELPFEDASFDTAVSTLVLCTVPEPDAALREIRRVLRPGGRLLFLEHVRSDDPAQARRQDRLAPVQRCIGHGCNPNRDTAAAIERAGFRVERLEHGHVPKAPGYLRPLIQGAATAP